MTGYGSAEILTDKYHYKAEIKSLNGKFLELNLRIPKLFSDKEMVVRNHLSAKLVRGSVSVYLSIEKQRGPETEPLEINTVLAEQYYKSWKNLADHLGVSNASIFESLMQIPEIIKMEEPGYEHTEWELMLQTIDKALEQLNEFRSGEGRDLQRNLLEHCRCIESMIPEIESFESGRLENTKQKLLKSLNELAQKEDYDKNRFEQELIYYLEKLDISEEKNRLKSHCAHFQETLEEEQNGRKLNFIAQEMGREINTLGAKAGHAGMQKTVVKMKEELEKIKEQVLNVL